LLQIGQQNLAFGLKFNAKAVLDCYEKDLEILSYGQRRDIEFKMVEGDFETFRGRWSIVQVRDVISRCFVLFSYPFFWVVSFVCPSFILFPFFFAVVCFSVMSVMFFFKILLAALSWTSATVIFQGT